MRTLRRSAARSLTIAAVGWTAAACAPGGAPSGRGADRAGAGTGRPEAPADVRRAVEAEIAKSLDATRRQDIDAFMAGFAPDFTIVGPDGTRRVTMATLRAETLRDWGIIPATRDLRMRVDSLSALGDSAVVWTSQRWDRLMLERDGVTRDTVVTTQGHRELWRRTAAGWRRARVTELGGTVEVNGKPYTPRG